MTPAYLVPQSPSRPATILFALIGVQLWLMLPGSFPLRAQETLQQIEARAARLKAGGDAAGSLAEWQKAAALDPKSANIEDEVGFLLAVLQRHGEALQHLEKAVELDPHLA